MIPCLVLVQIRTGRVVLVRVVEDAAAWAGVLKVLIGHEWDTAECRWMVTRAFM